MKTVTFEGQQYEVPGDGWMVRNKQGQAEWHSDDPDVFINTNGCEVFVSNGHKKYFTLKDWRESKVKV